MYWEWDSYILGMGQLCTGNGKHYSCSTLAKRLSKGIKPAMCMCLDSAVNKHPHTSHPHAHTPHTHMHTHLTPTCTHTSHPHAHTPHTHMHTHLTPTCTHLTPTCTHTSHPHVHTSQVFSVGIDIVIFISMTTIT